ncbi:MAG: hypothetical protein COV10_04820 [Candidatus Vogelbacteria bacterium CG10_big_fil_rev_8_21_14_0_10_51_16]|uniref:Ribosomal RNA large subunit methyltransferase K/L-like methyltransferase domain-containing protein n=1 Tax=Candidatus Vogelbacteria bacterium CG10_big_fil_rev_8_21_14_0_10_51_16 TaxID=1975045 RepID=A0A2H0RD07_9BACT|nr:MAG: hypothetical protein COV10_04820 [Candidatus Vogelbacteria bacterium CG10_big_fil_rev_8_21_14_0_10_51_16]
MKKTSSLKKDRHFGGSFASTFPAGLQEVVRETLLKKRGKFHILHLLDGLVIYETTYSERILRDLRYFTNTFRVHEVFEKVTPSEAELACLLDKIERNGLLLHHLAKSLPPHRYTFSVITSLENAMVPLPPDAGHRLVQTLLTKLPIRHRVKNPELEFWLYVRREGIGFFGTRITYPQKSKKVAGKLRPALAHLLCLLSGPHPRDSVLDPFAGHGGIILERAGHFPYSSCVALEADAGLVQTIKREAGRLHLTRFTARADDATSLATVPDHSITKIITDPPWGLYAGSIDKLDALYGKALHSFSRVLVGGGIAVVLSGAPEVFRGACKQLAGQFAIVATYPILVSGKKATVFKLRRLIQKETSPRVKRKT